MASRGCEGALLTPIHPQPAPTSTPTPTLIQDIANARATEKEQAHIQ